LEHEQDDDGNEAREPKCGFAAAELREILAVEDIERAPSRASPRSRLTADLALGVAARDGHQRSPHLKHFDSWNGFVRAAGLIADDRSRIADEDLFEAMRDAFLKAGGVVTRTALRKVCRYSDDVYAKRWGCWPNALARFRAWAEEHEPGFPYLDDLPREPAEPVVQGDDSGSRAAAPAWTSTQRTQYGPFLNFRGLQHAPINEQGVVFLFGMVAFDLGYVVEGVGTGFPDCEAKRCVTTRRQ
jgi:hypothetical protein